MAIIQKIRNKAGLLVAVIIGMALLAFILGDILTSGNLYLNKNRTNVAVVNGKNITIDIFQQMIQEQEELVKMQMGVNSLDEQALNEVRQRTWTDMIQSLLLDREFQKLGLSVSSDELFDMINGENPHPFIMQFFADPNTGQINRMALSQFLQQVNELEQDNTQKMFWLYLEDLIYKERKNQKYNTLLRQGLYTTSLEATRRKQEMNTSVSISYLVKRYNEIPDSLIEVSADEIKAYYKEHKNEFKQQKSRDIRYLVWEVVPSEKDYLDAQSWINEIKPEFESIEAENADQYARANSDLAPDSRNLTRADLDSALSSFAFSANEGDVYGPYFEGNYYKLAKLANIVILPDSVKASHILLTAQQNSDVAAIRKLADSLKTLLEKGANISELAIRYSADEASAQKGGDLGWFKEGSMVKPFSDSCFYGKTGQVKLVYTNYGMHIIKIEGQSAPSKKVQVSVLAHEVRISEATDQDYFAKASEFGALYNTKEKFDKALADQQLVPFSALNLRDDANTVNNLESSRELVRWAFSSEEGTVTPKVLQFENKYVVAILDKAREKGFAPVEEVKNSISNEIRKQKQADQLIAKIEEAKKGASDINSIAAKLNTNVNTASNLRFTAYSIPGIGVEPELQAVATSLEAGKLSSPIVGNNGVYVLQVDTKDAAEAASDVMAEKSFLNRSYAARVNYSSMNVLTELAGVEDNRINFF
ncbi:MAG: SurA N-terminal domain-containing protein [Bacteroidota bacterium]|nr:MAG: SurA N-terminal domain-containing protein [Bacteroidota bacterium]